jgi:group I intron endonuclease
MNKYTIYKITNIINNKIYIGQTIRELKYRIKNYKYYSKNKHKNNLYIYNAMYKYGFESFTFEIIDEAAQNQEELNSKEIYYISFYNSTDPNIGYNIDCGGNKTVVTDITRDKISKTLTGRKLSQKTKDKISKSHIGKVHTLEHNDNVSKSLSGKKLSQNHINKLSNAHIGKKLSQDHIDKIIKSKKGKTRKPFSNETKNKMSQIHIGKELSNEIKNKISLSNKGKISGSKNNNAKLNDEKVIQILLKIKNGAKNKDLAKEFEVSEQTISFIRNNKIWRHISRDI